MIYKMNECEKFKLHRGSSITEKKRRSKGCKLSCKNLNQVCQLLLKAKNMFSALSFDAIFHIIFGNINRKSGLNH